jgi:autotransporter-associated beta strand protein
MSFVFLELRRIFNGLGDGWVREVVRQFKTHMYLKASSICFSLLTVLLWLPGFEASAQTLTITNGVQTYASLASTTVTMSNRCELHVTSATAPLSGCTINLNSADAWLFLTGIKPSVVASTYLSQVFVNGAAAVANSNVRVVQYGQYGAVVIPQPPSFQPLTVFSGPYFTGMSASYSQCVYYTGAALGAMANNCTSFKLKRGYMAVVAQGTAADGSSTYSKCYIAQDGDLEIGILPAPLQNQINFIYVTPWRWASKKGIAGNPPYSWLNVNWWYDWNIDQSSTSDLEYVPIRAQRYWPGLSQNWQSLGANTLLGYNEPDSASQANIAVGDAIWSWPDLLGTGLRVGSPAVTDGGVSSWLVPFMQQANTNGLRVDFVAQHYYQAADPSNPTACANQLYNFLLNIWNKTHLPIWLTEWNNGANWTDNSPYAPPTYAQQQADIAAMTAMLESTPFVERYALYNWVEDTRSLVTSSNTVTAAGVTYSNLVSALSYRQAMPDNGTRSLAQYSFETNTLDTSGYGNNALASSAPAYAAGYRGQAVVLDGTNNYIQLPANIANSSSFTFAAWVNWNGGVAWQRIFDFGDDESHYLFLTPNSGGSTLRFAINNGGGEQQLNAAILPSGSWQHVCVTISGSNAKLYTNGVLAASSSSLSITPASITPMYNFLGKSQFPADPLFAGKVDEVQIADYAFTQSQIAALMTDSPPQFSTNLIVLPGGSESVAYSNNIIGMATGTSTLTYSLATGPAWLSVSTNGILTGTPGAANGGTNYFTVRATDAAGASAFSVVSVYVPVIAANGVWINDGNGLWSTTNNWSNGAVGTGIGETADFSTINITASRTVTLDSSRSLGTLKFGDTSGAQNWTLASSGGFGLTLDNGSATSPSIAVNQNTVTNLVSLSGTNGFTKSSAGTLILGVGNSLSGTLNVDTAQGSSGNDGMLRIASPNGFGSVSAINIRNQNAAYSTLQLDGTNGNISSSAPITLNGRNNSVVAIEHLDGNSTLNGNVTLGSGGSSYLVQSDSGLLTFGGTFGIQALTSGRTLTFQGAGNFLVSGAITNGATYANTLLMAGSGNLTLAGNNSYAGTTTVNRGALLVDGSLGTNSVTVASGGTLGGNGVISGPVTLQAGATLAPGDSIGVLTISNSLTLNAATTNRFAFNEAQAANSSAFVAGTLNAGSSPIALAINGTLRGGYYRLFNYGTLNGTFNPTLIILSGSVDGVATLDQTVPGQINLMVSNSSSATNLIPYSADANTLVLFHLDEAAGGSQTTNVGTLGKNAYTVNMTTASTTPPTVTGVLGVSGQKGFGNAANFNPSGYLAGFDSANNGAYNGETVDTITMGSLNMGNGGQTPWTIEAMICPSVTNASQEIICTDSSAANRGFQFRLNASGQLELNLIYAGVNPKVAIPSSGANAFAPNNWYHVAATYDGSKIVLYWTKIYPTITAINPISTNAAVVGASFGSVTGPLVIGNENRGAAGENFQGLIDEVRISSVARSATNFLWHPLAPAAPTGLAATVGSAQANLVWSNTFSATSYNVKRATTNGGDYTIVANVNLPAYTDAGLTNGVAYYYVISALNAGGESANSVQVNALPVSTQPFSIGAALTGNQLQLVWPMDHIGWRLQAQTNSLGSGLGTNWIDVAGSMGTNQFYVPITVNNDSVFYRLTYP